MPIRAIKIVEVEQAASSDACPRCGAEIRIGMYPFCRGSAADHGAPAPHHPIPGFEIEHEGRRIAIDGIHSADEIARESMKRYRDGAGAPIVFRDFHQDRSNRDRNTLAEIAPSRQVPNPRKPTFRGRPPGVED